MLSVCPKNWRPTILVFSGNPLARLSLVTYAGWLGMNCGIISVVEVLVGELRDISADQQEEARERAAAAHRVSLSRLGGPCLADLRVGHRCERVSIRATPSGA